jgi:hypothetical protein
MLASSKDLKNIPISLSFLHDQEYKNICLTYRLVASSDKKRRAFSESKRDRTACDTKKITTYTPRDYGK